MDMRKIAKQFQNDHLGKGVVDKVTDYSFRYTTTPKNENEKPKETIYMESWFVEL